MSRAPRAVLLSLLAFVAAGCVDIFLPQQPAADPVTVFDAFWHEYDAHYAFFDLKSIDWDSVYDEYRPRIRPGMDESMLASTLGAITMNLRDGHADLYTPYGNYSYDGWYTRYPANFDSARLFGRYVHSGPPSEAPVGPLRAPGLLYGWVSDRIGYIYIGTFDDDGVRKGIDRALADLMSRGVDGIVVDIRDNGGGSDKNTDAVAARLMDRRRLYRHYKYRNGPRHDDFTPVFDGYIEPAGDHRFTGPVAVLTNRSVFSAAETFVLAMRVRPNTIIVGDTTGGGSGNPLWRELPNGWTFRVPRWIEWGVRDSVYEGVGLGPDTVVQFTGASDVLNADPICSSSTSSLHVIRIRTSFASMDVRPPARRHSSN
jgi:carboxyl-terminal processing protease